MIILIMIFTHSFLIPVALFVCLQVKKSGKDPKVGAEITLGENSRKTTVRCQTSFS